MTAPVCFVDTETSGLDPERHEIWEVGLITPDGEEHHWFLSIDESRADLIALGIGGYFERHPRHVLGSAAYRNPSIYERGPDGGGLARPHTFCAEFQRLTRGLHLAGAVVSFDAERLYRYLMFSGYMPAWHYHLIDVEALAVGYLSGVSTSWTSAPGRAFPPARLALPWSSTDVSKMVGVDPDQFDKHTALGDALWAKAIYEAVMGP